MRHEDEWEAPLFDDGHLNPYYPHQDSTSPPSTLTRTPVDHYLPTCPSLTYWDPNLPGMAEFPAPVTFNWVDYYAGESVTRQHRLSALRC